MHRKRTPRRQVFVALAVSLLVGIMATAAFVIVPTGIATYIAANRTTPVTIVPTLYRLPRALAGDDTTRVYYSRRFARQTWTVERKQPSTWIESLLETVEYPAVKPDSAADYPEASIPRWAELPPPQPGHGRRVCAYGWPFPCMVYRADTLVTVSSLPGSGTFNLPQLDFTTDFRGRVQLTASRYTLFLPSIPLWTGLLTNILFFATLTGLLFLIPPARRLHRRREGRCPGCGYELRGLATCPECGRLFSTSTGMRAS